MNNTYIGIENQLIICNGQPLNPRTHIWEHTKAGFRWGTNSPESAQLALAIIYNEFGNDYSKHPIFYQDFKRGVINQLKPNFKITSDNIRNFIQAVNSPDSSYDPVTDDIYPHFYEYNNEKPIRTPKPGKTPSLSL